MECKWKDCDGTYDGDFIHHVNAHIESQTEYMCLWQYCKKYGEKQSSKYALQAHVRKHTNDRPFGCKKCTKQYTRSDALNKHSKNHLRLEEEINDLYWKLESIKLKRDALQIMYNRVLEEGVLMKSDVEILINQALEEYTNKHS